MKEDLQPLFDVADKNHKNSLNFNEFKNCAFEYEHKKTVFYLFFVSIISYINKVLLINSF